MSKVYFVGCGPGDPDLITIKAKKLVQKADVIVYSGSLIPSEILKYNKKGKKHDAAKLVREEILDLLLKNSKKAWRTTWGEKEGHVRASKFCVNERKERERESFSERRRFLYFFISFFLWNDISLSLSFYCALFEGLK